MTSDFIFVLHCPNCGADGEIEEYTLRCQCPACQSEMKLSHIETGLSGDILKDRLCDLLSKKAQGDTLSGQIFALLADSAESAIRTVVEEVVYEQYCRDHGIAVPQTTLKSRAQEQKNRQSQLKKYESEINSVLEKARELVFWRKEPEKAVGLLESLIGKFSPLNSPHEDEQNIYVSLNDSLQEYLYLNLFPSEKTVRKPALNLGPVYLFYGYSLIETEALNQAENVLREAWSWCPMESDYAFEYIEVFKMKHRFEEFKNLTLEAMKRAYLPRAIARAYRNLGYYYTEMKDYHTAVMLNLASLVFEKDNPKVEQELDYISRTGNIKIRSYSQKEISSAFAKRGIPIGPDHEVLRQMWSFAEWCREHDHLSAAKSAYSLVYDLTRDDKAKNLADSLPDDPKK